MRLYIYGVFNIQNIPRILNFITVRTPIFVYIDNFGGHLNLYVVIYSVYTINNEGGRFSHCVLWIISAIFGYFIAKKAQNQLNGEDDTVSRDFIIRDEDIEKDEDTEEESDIDYLKSKLWRYEFWYNF